jgi:hypothetical protein
MAIDKDNIKTEMETYRLGVVEIYKNIIQEDKRTESDKET